MTGLLGAGSGRGMGQTGRPGQWETAFNQTPRDDSSGTGGREDLESSRGSAAGGDRSLAMSPQLDQQSSSSP